MNEPARVVTPMYLSPANAAIYLGVKKSLILEWTRGGILPVSRINKKVLLYCRLDLDKSMALCRSPSVFEQLGVRKRARSVA